MPSEATIACCIAAANAMYPNASDNAQKLLFITDCSNSPEGYGCANAATGSSTGGSTGGSGTLPGFGGPPGSGTGTATTGGTNPNNPALPNITVPGSTTPVTTTVPANGTQSTFDCPAFALLDPFPAINCFARKTLSYLAVNFIALLFIVFAIYLVFRPEINAAIGMAAKDGKKAAVLAAL